jgi:hypothetical protein
LTCSEALITKLSLDRGTSKTLKVTITTDVGDITGAKLVLGVEAHPRGTPSTNLLEKRSANNGGSDAEAKIIDGVNRIIHFFFVKADTLTTLSGNRYRMGALILLPGSSDPVTLISTGYLDVNESVAEEIPSP